MRHSIPLFMAEANGAAGGAGGNAGAAAGAGGVDRGMIDSLTVKDGGKAPEPTALKVGDKTYTAKEIAELEKTRDAYTGLQGKVKTVLTPEEVGNTPERRKAHYDLLIDSGWTANDAQKTIETLYGTDATGGGEEDEGEDEVTEPRPKKKAKAAPKAKEEQGPSQMDIDTMLQRIEFTLDDVMEKDKDIQEMLEVKKVLDPDNYDRYVASVRTRVERALKTRVAAAYDAEEKRAIAAGRRPSMTLNWVKTATPEAIKEVVEDLRLATGDPKKIKDRMRKQMVDSDPLLRTSEAGPGEKPKLKADATPEEVKAYDRQLSAWSRKRLVQETARAMLTARTSGGGGGI